MQGAVLREVLFRRLQEFWGVNPVLIGQALDSDSTAMLSAPGAERPAQGHHTKPPQPAKQQFSDFRRLHVHKIVAHMQLARIRELFRK